MEFSKYLEQVLAKDKIVSDLYSDKGYEFKFRVANLITEARIYSGYTQSELAKKIGTKQPSIARIERGTSLPSLSFLQKIAKALNTYLIAPKFGFMEHGSYNFSGSMIIPLDNTQNNYSQSGYYSNVGTLTRSF